MFWAGVFSWLWGFKVECMDNNNDNNWLKVFLKMNVYTTWRTYVSMTKTKCWKGEKSIIGKKWNSRHYAALRHWLIALSTNYLSRSFLVLRYGGLRFPMLWTSKIKFCKYSSTKENWIRPVQWREYNFFLSDYVCRNPKNLPCTVGREHWGLFNI